MIGFLKALRGALILVALLMAIIPLVILISLLTGGTGYGLCQFGLLDCDTAFLTGPLVAARICGGLLIVATLVRVLSRIISRMERDRHRERVRSYYSDWLDWTENLRER
ncbi:MAG: hypothetical protein OXH10_06800 [bacterium]|nr:hypothetical protein [bacterium]MCY3579545.1 hypothetical protein [bacterium]MDE0644567.1 hypothetical protein [bacterium]MYD04296.1 hypothetical protein [Acidimicrobiia bacterium]